MNKGIIFITIDCGRYDRFEFNGYNRVKHPNLKKLADKGTVYHMCYAQAARTPVSHASFLSGVNPYDHGLRRMYDSEIGDDVPMIQEQLKDDGYFTCAFSGYNGLLKEYGLQRGFDYCDDDSDLSQSWGKTKCGFKGNLWLENFKKMQLPKKQKVFAWLHYFHAHTGSDKVLPEKYKHLREDFPTPELNMLFEHYDAKIKWFDDEWMPAIFEKFPPENFTYIVSADHGEDFGKFEVGHGHTLSNETLHIPMIVKSMAGVHYDNDHLVSSTWFLKGDNNGNDFTYSENEYRGCEMFSVMDKNGGRITKVVNNEAVTWLNDLCAESTVDNLKNRPIDNPVNYKKSDSSHINKLKDLGYM